ncbi:MAG: DEAD/DEAH box helicase [Micrococcaceae bacterium]
MSETTSGLSFADLNLHPSILSAVDDAGYTEATQIQAQTIPLLLGGNDVVGLAQTGTGKTAAFAIPALSALADHDYVKTPQVLVLTPTRELAIQVAENFENYAKYLSHLKVATIYGGSSYGPQLSALKGGAQIVVGTPGRMIDHLKKGSLKLHDIQYLVLDEADEMLRMGFQEDVETILEQTPEQKQVALFSATMPPAIRKIAQKYLHNPEEILVKSKTTTGENVNQRFILIKQADKPELTLRVLEVEDYDAAIIFVRTRAATETLAEKLRSSGLRVGAINGDIPQQQRERTVERLRDGSIDVLVATDVAARGLDVRRISLVINYDIPLETESYVHRIGRTGRAGQSGEAILFVTPREKGLLRNIERATKQPVSKMPLPSAEDVRNLRLKKFGETILRMISLGKDEQYQDFLAELAQENDVNIEQLAGALAFMQHGNRYLDLKQISEPTDDKKSKNTRGGRRDKEKFSPAEGSIVYKLNVGRKNRVQPGAIVGALANEGGMRSSNIGHIDIRPDFSLVALAKPLSKDQFRKLKDTKVAGQFINMKEDRGGGGGRRRDFRGGKGKRRR